MDYEAAKFRARTQRGWVKRRLDAVINSCNYADQNPSKFASTQVETAWTELQDAYKKSEEAYVACQEEGDDDEFDEWEVKLQEISDILEQARRDVTNILSSAAPPAQPLYQQPIAGAMNFRCPINETLKPGVLSLENSPVEFRQWVEKLKSFFTSNHLGNADLLEQQAYVKQFLDTDLNVRIGFKLDDMTEVFEADGMISLIQEEFKKRYPLFTCRLDYFRYTRKQGQSASNFIANLVQMGHEADLASLDVDQLQVFRVLTGVKEDALLTKLLELQDPTFENVRDRVTRWETNKSSKKSIVEDKEKESRTRQTKQGKKPSGKGNGKGKKNERPEVTLEWMKGRCFVCTSPKHQKNDCPIKDPKCKKCGKTGHIVHACLSDFFKKNPSSRPSTRPSSPSGGAPAATGGSKSSSVRAEDF